MPERPRPQRDARTSKGLRTACASLALCRWRLARPAAAASRARSSSTNCAGRLRSTHTSTKSGHRGRGPGVPGPGRPLLSQGSPPPARAVSVAKFRMRQTVVYKKGWISELGARGLMLLEMRRAISSYRVAGWLLGSSLWSCRGLMLLRCAVPWTNEMSRAARPAADCIASCSHCRRLHRVVLTPPQTASRRAHTAADCIASCSHCHRLHRLVLTPPQTASRRAHTAADCFASCSHCRRLLRVVLTLTALESTVGLS